MRLRTLLQTPALGLRLLGGEDELDRAVRGVMTTDLSDPSRYLSGGELVLTGLAWHHGEEDSEPFVRHLARAGVAGLAAGEAEQAGIPEDLVAACARHRLPLFSVSEAVAFATITEHVVRQVSTERAGDLAAVVDRHRRLMSSGPAGGGPDAVLDLLGSDLDLRAWVLSATGLPIAGAGGAPTLAGTVRSRLAGAHLAAERSGRPGPHRAVVDGVTYSLFAVRGGGDAGSRGPGTESGLPYAPGRDLRATVLSDWLLAVEADADDWPAERLDLLDGVGQLVAVERERRDAARAVRRRLAQEVLELVQGGAPPAEIAARLRVAAPVLLPGLGAAPHWQVVVARVDWSGGGNGGGVSGGPVAQSLLEETLVDPLAGQGRWDAGGGAGVAASTSADGQAADTGSARAGGPEDRVAVAVVGENDEAVALVPLLPEPESGSEPQQPSDAADGARDGDGGLAAERLLAAVRAPLEAGLGDDGRLTLGVSATVHSPEGLRGALEEARHARRVAAARPGAVCAAGHEELASHVLLLPFVPDDVRRAFTARLLAPVRDYDRRHRSELLDTLAAFLAADGSWTRCASRLHLHVNTLRYRIGRIEQLTGRDLSRLEDKLDFFLALRMS